jgi:serine-type D-Ala-D-Ala carboxypeptidase/endopeptidase (penicillin-binding protein 4)
MRRPRPIARLRLAHRRRVNPLPVRAVSIVLAAIAIPTALVLVGFHERGVAKRGYPLAVQDLVGAPRVSTPVFSLRRIPSTVAQPLVSDSLRQKLNSLKAQLPPASCLLVDADGVPAIEKDSTKALIPASNMKLITAAVALEVIGPEYRYVTKMYGDVSKSNPSKIFELYVIGSGDPLLSTPKYREASKKFEYYVDTPWTPFEDLALQLKAQGITEVGGDVYGDNRHYDASDLGAVSSSVSPIGGLVANDSLKDYTPGISDRAKDPTIHAVDQLIAMLKFAGVTTSPVIAARKVQTADDNSVNFLGEVTSAPLKDIVANMLTRSDNDTAEMLLREIAVRKNKPGTRAGGIEAVREVLSSWGIPIDALSQVDGSGLDRANTVSCEVISNVLRHVGAGSSVALGLPTPGRGTLVNSFGRCAVKDTLSAKTGTLNEAKVHALSGFVTAIGGHTISFSLLLNDTTQAKTNDVFSALCDAFGAFPGRIDVSAFGPSEATAV